MNGNAGTVVALVIVSTFSGWLVCKNARLQEQNERMKVALQLDIDKLDEMIEKIDSWKRQ